MDRLLECISANEQTGLKRELDEWNWTEAQLTEAFVSAVRIRSMECVDVLMEHPQTVFSLSFIQGSKLGVLSRLVEADDAHNLRAQLEHGQWTDNELSQVLLDSVRRGSYNCLDVLIHNPDVPAHHRIDNGKTILHELLERSELFNQTEDKLVNIVIGICEKLNVLNREDAEDMPSDADGTTGRLLNHLAGVEQWSPLHWAIHCGNLPVVECLMQYGANVNQESNRNLYMATIDTPLSLAISSHHLDIAKLLIKCGADMVRDICPDGSWRSYSLGAHILAQDFPKPELEEMLFTVIQHAGTFQPINVDDVSKIFKYGNPKCVMFILDNNLDTFIENSPLCSLNGFILALALVGKWENLITLMDNLDRLPVNLNSPVVEAEKLAPFLQIESQYFEEVIKLDGADALTPLQFALRCGYPALLRVLLEHSVDTDEKGEFAIPPICHIMEYKMPGGIECYVRLLRYGCNLIDEVFMLDYDEYVIDMSLLDYYLSCSNLFVCKMLAMIGLRKYSLQNINRNGITSNETMHEHVMVEKISDVEFDRFISEELNEAPTLYQLARIVVRGKLSRNIDIKTQQLALPTHVKAYLNFEELDYLGDMYASYKNKYNL